MRIITPATLILAFIVGCLDEDPPKKPVPSEGGKADNANDDLELTPDGEPVEEDPTCGARKKGDGECVPEP